MRAVIGYWSALEYWRFLRSHGEAAIEAYLELPECMPGEGLSLSAGVKEVRQYVAAHRMTMPLHVLIDRKEQYRTNGFLRCHLNSKKARVCLYRMMEESVYLSSPELMFVQMSTVLDTVDLIRLGYELCSTFAIDAWGNRIDSLPLTSISDIRSVLDAIGGLGNRARAVRALDNIQGSPDSPPEIELAMKMTLLHRWGGLQVENAKVNPRIELSKEAQAITGTGYCKGDFFCADIGFDIEYDSAEWHSKNEEKQRDERRRLALEHDGILVRPIDAKGLGDREVLTDLAHEIAVLRGQRFRTRSKAFLNKTDELWKRFENGALLSMG